ncbi:MAG: AraC family transcriptional regulator [Nannocystaceae bacterium]
MTRESDSRAEYAARVNRVLDHIEANLDRRLSLAELAEVASFSPYHFHRIFSALVGETLGQFVQRLRLERAAAALLGDRERSVTAVALDCGFSSPSTFARAFKEAFGVSATRWRAGEHAKICEAKRKIGKALRKPGEALTISDCYLDPQTQNPKWRVEMAAKIERDGLTATIEVEEREPLHVVYLRHTGPYGQVDLMPTLIAKLQRWAIPRGYVDGESRVILVAHDNPSITDGDKLRLSVCFTAPEGARAEGEFGTMTIAGGRYAVARVEIEREQIAAAWDLVCAGWLPESGYQPDDRPCYEVMIVSPREHPQGRIVLDLCVPVRPL